MVVKSSAQDCTKLNARNYAIHYSNIARKTINKKDANRNWNYAEGCAVKSIIFTPYFIVIRGMKTSFITGVYNDNVLRQTMSDIST